MYEVKYGIDPSASFAAAMESAEAALKLNPADALIHMQISLVHRLRGEHEIDIGKDARPSLQLAAAAVKRALELHPKSLNPQRQAATVAWDMVLDALEMKRNPEQAIEKCRSEVEELKKIDAADLTVFYLEAQLDIATARWAAMNGGNGDAAFASGRAKLEEALRRYPDEDAVVTASAELEVFAAEAEVKRNKERALEIAGRGLAWLAKLRNISDTLPIIVAWRGALNLVSAKASRSAKERSTAARSAETFLTEALTRNRFLERQYGPLLAEAKEISKAIQP